MRDPVEATAAWVLPAEPSAIGELRHRAAGFAASAGASEEVTEAIALAVSETVTNAIVHGYGGEDGRVRLSCQADGDRFIVEVVDEGAGVAARQDSPGVGHGLSVVGALAQTLEITPAHDGRGTVVRMTFGSAPPLDSPGGLESLCELAIQTIADVSCLDLVHGGVLRRVAAEVAGDPALTTWLLAALPPAKPGTATWAALREGGARLVVHDPAVPRSPGGPGERLDLSWWVAVPLEKPDGTPAALWGLGGRAARSPVPSGRVIGILTEAAHGDLTQSAEREALRTWLGGPSQRSAAGGRS